MEIKVCFDYYNLYSVSSSFASFTQVPVVQTLDSPTHRINNYPADNAIVSHNTYPLESDSSGGLRYPAFEQHLGLVVKEWSQLPWDISSATPNLIAVVKFFTQFTLYSILVANVSCVSLQMFYLR